MTGLQKFLAGLAVLVALVAGGVIGIAGIGHKYGVLDMAKARMLLEYGFYAAAGAAAAAALVILLALVRQSGGGVISAIFALAVGGGVAYVPWTMHQKETTLPVLNDITTDLANPPAFATLANERKNFASSAEYDPANAPKQKAGYPDIVTLSSKTGAGPLYAKALSEVTKQGWQVAAKNPETGIIEATSVSAWFGFKEDIVIRVTANGDGALLDMRSASREAGTDFGSNADRIRAFIAAVK